MHITEIDMGEIEQWAPPAQRLHSIVDELLSLDSVFKRGLQFHQFKDLFGICRGCRLVMTKRVIPIHLCIPADMPKENVIDLTGEE